MNIEISTSGSENNYTTSSSLPQPSILLKKEKESWHGSSGFGLANILNQSNSSSTSPSLPPPQFNLPSLQSFGKPDPSMNRSRSILNESSPAPSKTREANLHETSPPTSLSTGFKVPLMTETPQKAGTYVARRIAPARLDEEDGDGEVEETVGTENIRGGRWSPEEHDRFLAGFRIHGHKWKRVQQVVRTRSVTQVRTHAQKYLLKLAKLNADKKNSGRDGQSSSDTETNHTAGDSDTRSPRKKTRRSLNVDSMSGVDEEYISAAATTLCFLMRQKIDSLFDSRHDDDNNLEPFDCYSNDSADTNVEHSIDRSRKRPYMDLVGETTTDYHGHTHDARMTMF